jgi:colanic acid/amylovoran biosynthesis glycosyltransferase
MGGGGGEAGVERNVGSRMIHYITTNGIGNPWVAAEIEIVDRAGVPFRLHTMRAPSSHFFKSEWGQRLSRESRVLYPLPVFRTALDVALAPFRFRQRFFGAMWNALTGERESLRARVAGIAHCLVACHWAASLKQDDVSLIHSQWIHSCGTIGMYAAWLLGVPFSFTGHAVDLFRDRVALRDKVRRADFIVCISSFHRDLYLELGAPESKLHTVFCGINVRQFTYAPRPESGAPVRILSVGRLIEKKGFEYLIDACATLKDRGLKFHCVIAGDGPLERPLRERIERLKVGDVVELTGKPVMQEDLPKFMETGDIFAQPCVWAVDGDVDGTPRTLMEAMASGNAAISTRLAGIPDIVEHEVSGLLVQPNDAAGLADAMHKLITDRKLTARLAAGGRKRMEQLFEIEDCVDKLVRLFRQKLTAQTAPVMKESVA